MYRDLSRMWLTWSNSTQSTWRTDSSWKKFRGTTLRCVCWSVLDIRWVMNGSLIRDFCWTCPALTIKQTYQGVPSFSGQSILKYQVNNYLRHLWKKVKRLWVKLKWELENLATNEINASESTTTSILHLQNLYKVITERILGINRSNWYLTL